MPFNIYDLGDPVKVWAAFKNAETQAAIDPDVINLSVKNPAGAVTTYTHGVDANVFKDDVGHYYVIVNANAPGFWFYRWWSAGFGQTAKERNFKIRAAQAIEA
jgi:hypothetical protein